MLKSHIDAEEAKLLANSKIPANTGHPNHKGAAREAFVKEFLETHLGSTVSIGTGEIVDSDSKPGQPRNQFDIVIYKSKYPKLDFGGDVNGFLAESVVATIEVKSKLDAIGIAKSVRAARAAKGLKRNFVKSFQAGYGPPAILSYVVAYRGPAKMQTIHTWIKQTHAAEGIAEPDLPVDSQSRHATPSPSLDGVFVLGRGFCQYDNATASFISPQLRKDHPELKWVMVDVERGSLLMLFLLLLQATSGVEGAWLDAQPYVMGVRANASWEG